jgi:hypothetical protein
MQLLSKTKFHKCLLNNSKRKKPIIMKKFRIYILVIFILQTACVFSQGKNIEPVALYSFTKQILEIRDKEYRIIDTQPQIAEYRLFDTWETGGEHWKIKKIDFVGIVKNHSSKNAKNIKVVFTVLPKVGKMLGSDKYDGVLDLVESLKTATWRNVIHVEEVTIDTLAPGESKTVSSIDFDLWAFMTDYQKRNDEWPFFIEVRMSTLCNHCDKTKKISYLIKTSPGD